MFQVIGFLVVSQGAQARDDNLLRISLARVNHVEDIVRVAERGGAGVIAIAGSDPGFVAVGMLVKTLVVKIAVEETELPKMMRDIFANVGDGTRGADDDFCFGFLRRFFGFCFGVFRSGTRFVISRVALRRKLHHPAARVFP